MGLFCKEDKYIKERPLTNTDGALLLLLYKPDHKKYDKANDQQIRK